MMMMMRMPSKCVLGECRAVPIFGEICSWRPPLLCSSPSAVLCNLQGLSKRATAASGAAPGVVTRCRGNRRQIKTSPVSDLLARALHFLTSFWPLFRIPGSHFQQDQKLTPADIRPRQSTKISSGHFQPLRADGPESLTFSNDWGRGWWWWWGGEAVPHSALQSSAAPRLNARSVASRSKAGGGSLDSGRWESRETMP